MPKLMLMAMSMVKFIKHKHKIAYQIHSEKSDI